MPVNKLDSSNPINPIQSDFVRDPGAAARHSKSVSKKKCPNRSIVVNGVPRSKGARVKTPYLINGSC